MFYQKHIFICTNTREQGTSACGDHATKPIMLHFKKRLKELGVHGKDKIRVSQSGCLGRCNQGPVMVIYPEGRWYQCNNEQQAEEIITQDIILNQTVDHLMLKD
jgi:(2Fe-2S) ferredoxin